MCPGRVRSCHVPLPGLCCLFYNSFLIMSIPGGIGSESVPLVDPLLDCRYGSLLYFYCSRLGKTEVCQSRVDQATQHTHYIPQLIASSSNFHLLTKFSIFFWKRAPRRSRNHIFAYQPKAFEPKKLILSPRSMGKRADLASHVRPLSLHSSFGSIFCTFAGP